MKRFVKVLPVLLAVSILTVSLSCSSKDEKILKGLETTESGAGTGEISRKRIAELKKGIEEYKKEADRTIKAEAEIGIYYRLVGLELMKLSMYEKAFENFKAAIEYYPENEVLFYYSGVALARSAKSVMEEDEQRRMMQKAAVYYRRAVELRPGYKDALYALSVLYLFELNKPFDALSSLEELLKSDPGNIDALFLKARACAATGNVRDAVDTYNRIIKTAGDSPEAVKAREFRDTLMSGGSNG